MDTNIVLYYLNNQLDGEAYKFVYSILLIECNISIVNRIEIRSWNAPTKEVEREIINFLDACTLFDLTLEVAEKAAELRRTYKKLAMPDTIIAATAIVNNMTLVSRNDKDFQQIKNLKYTNPFRL